MDEKIVDLAIGEIKKYYENAKKDINGRERSWEHCYTNFFDVILYGRPYNMCAIDYLSLHLGFYLASWGMYRGAAFLLQKDYRIHIPAVEIILKNKNVDMLIRASGTAFCDDMILDVIDELRLELAKYYSRVRSDVKKKRQDVDTVSDTLISKILLGTLGCVPAYDEYFVAAVRKYGVSTGVFNRKSIKKLSHFYCEYFDRFEDVREELSFGNKGMKYPTMKLLDMAFWQIGFDGDNS